MNQQFGKQAFDQADKLFKDLLGPGNFQALAEQGVAASRDFYEKTATQFAAVLIERSIMVQSVVLKDLLVAVCAFSNTCWDARVERSMNSLVCSVA